MSEKILNIVRNNSEITIDELSALLNKTTRTIERNIAKLKECGLLERIGANKGGYWKVKNEKR